MLASLTRRPAGLLRRLAALVYDWLLLIALMFGFTFLVIFLRGGEAVEPASWWFNASLVAISFAFFGWFWTHGGQTLGMRAWRLRLERHDGGAVKWPDAARRFLASWVLALPPGLGFFWGAIDREGLCWHDRLSRTRIVQSSESG